MMEVSDALDSQERTALHAPGDDPEAPATMVKGGKQDAAPRRRRGPRDPRRERRGEEERDEEASEEALMGYDYVKRTYGVDLKVGQMVRHTVTGDSGVVAREKKSQGHYVQVRFGRRRFALPCHPTELEKVAVLR